MEYTQKQIDTLKEELSNTLLEDYFCAEEVLYDVEDADDLYEAIQSRIYDSEVIYYTEAMAFLTVHDPSLKESLGLANDICYGLEGLDSELLATLLLRDMMIKELDTLDLECVFEE